MYLIKIYKFIFNLLFLSSLSLSTEIFFNASSSHSRLNIDFPKESSLQYRYSNSILSSPDFTQNKSILRVFGPLTVDINNSVVRDQQILLPAINKEGQPIILAIDCSQSQINVWTSSLWKGWLNTNSSFEKNILSFSCSSLLN